MILPNETKFSDLSNFKKNDKQLLAEKTLFSPNCKYLLYGGAAAGGKSYWLRWTALELALYYTQKYKLRNVPIGLFSEDYPTLKDRQISRIKREFPEWLGRLVESRDEGYVFKLHEKYGGASILLRNLDDPSKYASVEFAAILVEELTKNPKQTFDDLRFRLRYPGIKDTKFAAVTNPGGIGHGFVKQLWVEPDLSRADPEQHLFHYVHAKYSDNVYIDESYVNQLMSLPEDKRRAFMDGDWNIFAGQFFGEFRKGLHTTTGYVPITALPQIGGMDWGRTAPFVFLGSSVEKVTLEDGTKFNRIWTHTEIDGTNKTPVEVAELINKYTKLDDYTYVRCDPAMFHKKDDGSFSIHDSMKPVLNPNAFKFKPANNDRIGGWSVMHNWMSLAPDGKPYWIISENCRNLVRTLPELVHNPPDHGNVEDVDTKGADHWGDAARYMLQHLKWIDAKLQIIKPKEDIKKTTFGYPIDKAFVSNLDLDAFEKAPVKKK